MNYNQFTEELIKRQLILVEKGDRVAVIFAKEVTDELKAAIEDVKSYNQEELARLQEECVSTFCRTYGEDWNPQLDFYSERGEELVQLFLNDLVNSIQFQPSPEGWPEAPQILSSGELRALTQQAVIKGFHEKYKVNEFLGKSGFGGMYIEPAQQEQAILTALYVLAALDVKEKESRILGPGGIPAGQLLLPR